MNKLVKATSVAIAFSLLIGAAGCSLFTSRVSIDKFRQMMDDNNIKEVDPDDMTDTINEIDSTEDFKTLKKGIYSEMSGKDLKSFLKSNHVGEGYGVNPGYDSTMTEGIVYLKGDGSTSESYYSWAGCFKFETSDDAREYFQDVKDELIDHLEDAFPDEDFDDNDSDREGGYCLFSFSVGSGSSEGVIYIGMYQSRNCVLILNGGDFGGSKAKKDIAEICEVFGIETPTKIKKKK